jgi:orotidine-5'-phosphate decarboxylase
MTVLPAGRPPFTTLLAQAEARADSLLCVGLDPDPARFPAHLAGRSDRILDFCRAIVDATGDLVCAFKPQIAYFAAHRAEDQLEALIAHIRTVAAGVPVILDAKRGDIGATAEQYAREAFERFDADAVTLSPYMGFDSIEPYLAHEGRGLFLLCRTSNPGGGDLQNLAVGGGGERLYETVARLAAGPWNERGSLGLVVGATVTAELARVRAIAPTLPLLVPGVGAQGGDAAATVAAGLRRAGGRTTGPVIVNSSRAVLYAGRGEDFATAARAAARATRDELRRAAAALTDPGRNDPLAGR